MLGAMRKTGFAACILFLAACGGEQGVAPPQLQEAQREFYASACAVCHSSATPGVPQLGDEGAWQARLRARGIDGLIANAINGQGGMPPYGSCSACTEADIAALTRYLAAGREQ